MRSQQENAFKGSLIGLGRHLIRTVAELIRSTQRERKQRE